jgi:hypothetical protein
MTNQTQECTDGHAWRAYSDDEMKTLRSQARAGRPPGAWVEGAEQCERCSRVEAKVSWFGQLHRVPFAPRETGGQPVIQWPTRTAAPGSGMGMGQNST